MSNKAPALVWDSGKYEVQRKLGNFVQYFQVNLPTNGYGVPQQLINPYVIAMNMLDAETTDDIPEDVLDDALIFVEYDDGMPIIGGLPIWERFEQEPVDYYKLFKEYREMLYLRGTRAIARLAEQENIPGRYLSALAKVYHWQLRCRAFDNYKKMEYERKKQLQIEKLETKHSQVSSSLIESAMTYLEDHPEQLNPKVALQMLQLGMKAGRLALGLNPDKPGTTDAAPSINIQQTAGGGTSDRVETRIDIGGNGPQQEDMSYLQSIVHILDKTGALDQAKKNVIDADFEEVKDEQ